MGEKLFLGKLLLPEIYEMKPAEEQQFDRGMRTPVYIRSYFLDIAINVSLGTQT